MKLNRILSFLVLAAGLLAFSGCGLEEEEKEGLINEAQKLDKNTYSVKTSKGTNVYPLSQSDSRWYVGRSNIDKSQTALKVQIMDEDPEKSTMGYGSFELPPEIAGKLTTLNAEFARKYPWASGKFFTMRPEKEIAAHIGEGGNVKVGTPPQIWLKENGTRAFAGEYEFLFAVSFINEEYNYETGETTQGDEFTICGRAIVNPYTPTLTWFSIQPEKDWVKVGSTIHVEGDWDDGATFDWSKVKLVGQELGHSSSNPSDGGYFQWNSSDQTLKALKSSGNANVYLTFRYEGTELGTTCQVATGPGWEYTSFSFNPARLVMDKYDALSLTIEQYAPTNLTWDWTCLEIDPSTDPNGAFYIDKSSHKLYNFSGKVGQTYNLRLQVKSNPGVGAPLEVYVVEEKPNSFKITYEQNGTYKPWDNGSPNGICNYGMGLPLGVETNPADCYWSWGDLELMPGYDDTFSFSGVGGRNDHPKLMLKKSHDGTHPGVQVGFRLKYDHSKTSYIYVTHN